MKIDGIGPRRPMTDEALFSRQLIEDVRRCANGRAPAAVAEIEHRLRDVLDAEPRLRERRWAQVVAAVPELLTGLNETSAAAAHLRAFLRENADLSRPRDVAITDFRFVAKPDSIATDSTGRQYLLFARIPRAAPMIVFDEVVPGPTRRIAEFAVYGLCGGAAAAALVFAFILHI